MARPAKHPITIFTHQPGAHDPFMLHGAVREDPARQRWILDWTHNGERRRVPLPDATTVEQARAAAFAKVAELARPTPADHAWDALLEAFIESRTSDGRMGKAHAATVCAQVALMLEIMHDRHIDPAKVTGPDVARIVATLRAVLTRRLAASKLHRSKSPSSNTIRKYVFALCHFLDWYRGAHGGPGGDAFDGHSHVPVRARAARREVCLPEDVQRILDAADAARARLARSRNPYIGDAIYIGFYTGLRPSEVWSLRVGEINRTDDGFLINFTGRQEGDMKTAPSRRTLRVWPALEPVVKRLLEAARRRRDEAAARGESMSEEEFRACPLMPRPGSGGRVPFKCPAEGIGRVFTAAGFPKLTPDSWRHTYASVRVQMVHPDGTALARLTVSNELGHSSTATLDAHYLHRHVTINGPRDVLDYAQFRRAHLAANGGNAAVACDAATAEPMAVSAGDVG